MKTTPRATLVLGTPDHVRHTTVRRPEHPPSNEFSLVYGNRLVCFSLSPSQAASVADNMAVLTDEDVEPLTECYSDKAVDYLVMTIAAMLADPNAASYQKAATALHVTFDRAWQQRAISAKEKS